MKQKRFKRENWIELGLQELSAKGAEGIKLEAICAAANLTRGSFYHHFEDHGAFLTAVANQWVNSQTTAIAAIIDPDASPDEQGSALNEAAMQIDYRLELGIREIARRFAAIHEIVKQADAVRVDVLGRLYRQRFGLNKKDADELAFLEYAAFSGIILLDPDIPLQRQQMLAELYEGMMDRALGKKPKRATAKIHKQARRQR